jgi:transposase
MSKTTFYVGVDVGQEELVVAVEGSKTRSFKHTVAGIGKMVIWVKGLDLEGTPHFCLESTGVYSYSLASRLTVKFGMGVSIINAAQIAAFARAQLRRTKTDQVDAQVILNFAQTQHPPLWQPETKVIRHLYHLVVTADKLHETSRQWTNRCHCYKYIDDLPDMIRKTNQSLQRTLERQIIRIEKEIEKLILHDPQLSQQVQLLCSIPGVAIKSATRILAYGRRALVERNRKAIVAHAGLAPAQKQSGISIHGKSRLAKQGDRRLRKALFMSALVASHHNPSLKIFYQRLLLKGKPKMLAITAVMKKLLLMIQAILKNKTPFDPNYALDN